MVNEELKNFVKGALDKGEPKEKIAGELKANGWDQNDLNEVFNLLEKGIAPPVYATPLKSIPQARSGASKAILFLIILFIISGGAFAAYQFGYLDSILPKEEAAVVASDTVVEESPEPLDPFATWQTYTNTEYNFEIKYPSDWHSVNQSNEVVDQLILRNVAVPSEISEESVENESSFVVTNRKNSNASKLPIGAWFDKEFSTPSQILKDTKTNIQLGGKEAIRVEGSDIGHYYIYFIPNDVNVIQISYPTSQTKFQATYQQILSTFKFINN